VPELLLGLERAIERGDTARTEVLDRRVQEFITWIGRFPTPLAVKVAVSERGIKVGPSAFPLSPATKRGVEEFREWFRAWLPVVQKESENV
jgi:dihydrodipicolinate synthase/N-acetylneuraminate lyase